MRARLDDEWVLRQLLGRTKARSTGQEIATISGMDDPLSEIWPFFNLRLRTERLELRVPRPDDLVSLAAMAALGIHDANTMPFTTEWTDRPAPERQRAVLQWQWKLRSTLSPDDWTLSFAVVLDGVVVGLQDIGGTAFSVRREVITGSWLGRAHQGAGIGKAMRSAVLGLAFEKLGAEHAISTAREDNVASNRVSAGVGYQPDGTEVHVVRGRAVRVQRYRMSRDDWFDRERPTVLVENLDPCLPILGIVATEPLRS